VDYCGGWGKGGGGGGLEFLGHPVVSLWSIAAQLLMCRVTASSSDPATLVGG